MKKVLITGSCGLIGAQAVHFFAERDFYIAGIDNDMRAYFFGNEASTLENKKLIELKFKDKYKHYAIDIRDKKGIEKIFQDNSFELIIHTAAQPSHDWAVREPYTDFEINANGTLILLDNFKRYSSNSIFIFTSTNKVYGDLPNNLPFDELETRWDLPKGHQYFNGISETMSIDGSLHSLFGVSKASADILVQEYGRYFKLKTASFRCGCLTGPLHKGAELHGFLAYLAKCIYFKKPYTIYGYKGKQVRDNIHSFDLVNMFWHFYKNPRCAEVYNVGGSRQSNISILEAVHKIEELLSKKAIINYSPVNRIGDHIWYISDMSKFKSHYPEWDFHYNIDSTLEEICSNGLARINS